MGRAHCMWIIAGATLAGGALRFATLDVQSFGLDETFTSWLSRKDFGSMLSDMSYTEGTPPLYYVMAWLWSQVFGAGEVGLRSLSALMGTAVIPVAGYLASTVAGRRAAIAASVLVAVNPLLFWYSQEARAYALLVLLTSLSVVFLLRAREDPTRRRLTAWALSASLTLATHYFGVFIVGVEALVLLTGVPRRSALLACVAPVVTGLALLPLLVAQRETAVSELTGSTLRRVAVVLKQLMTGPNVPADWVIAGIVAGCTLVALATFRDPSRRRTVTVPAGLAVAAVALPGLLALAGLDYLAARYLLPAVIPAIVALSVGFATSLKAALAGAVVSAASLTAIALVQTDDRYQRVDYRDAADAIGPVEARRAIVYTPKAHMEVYLPGAELMPEAGAKVASVDVVSLTFTDRGRVSPPRGQSKPPPAGFEIVDRQEHSTFTLVRYVADEARNLRPATLSRLDLTPDDFPTVLLQAP